MALTIFYSFFEFPICAMNRFVKDGTANFGRNISTEISRPPQEVIPNIPVGRNRKGPFHLISDRNFRNLWHNGKHPTYNIVKDGGMSCGGFWKKFICHSSSDSPPWILNQPVDISCGESGMVMDIFQLEPVSKLMERWTQNWTFWKGINIQESKRGQNRV